MRRMDGHTQTALSLASLVLCSTGCDIGIFNPGIPGSGVVVTDARDIEDFNEIELTGSGQLTIHCGQDTALEVTTDDNLLTHIQTEVADGTLEIRSTERIDPTTRPAFDVRTPSLSRLQITGSGDVEILEFDGETLELGVAGSGRFKVSGVADSLKIHVAGSGKGDLSELVAHNISIEIAGSGSMYVNAIESLSVNVAGSGSVKYIGNPTVTQSIQGSGSVRQVQAE